MERHPDAQYASQTAHPMTVAVMPSINDPHTRAQFVRFLDRALAIRHAQLVRARRQRLQSGQSNYLFKPR
jgi:hypothetical protein